MTLHEHLKKEGKETQKAKLYSNAFIEKIPFITFSNDWEVQILPAYGPYFIRFRVKKENIYLNVILSNYINPDTGKPDVQWRLEAENDVNKRWVRFYATNYPNVIPPIDDFFDTLKNDQ